MSSKFFADHCVPNAVICALRDAGHEVLILENYTEDKALIAYRLVDEKYHVIFSVECIVEQDFGKVRIPPFEEVEIDLKYVFSGE